MTPDLHPTQAQETDAPCSAMELCCKDATEAVKCLQDAGFAAYLAGGCVRDLLRGTEPADYDLATDAMPEDVTRLFPGSVFVGKSFGVVRAPHNEAVFEIATFRREGIYEDGRHPSSVEFTDACTDALRRDFTVNALFMDPVHARILDYTSGLADLDAGVIRAVGCATDRFAEDHLRMLRAARFSSVLQFEIENETMKAIQLHAGKLKNISAERIRDELIRTLLESPMAGDALRLFASLGLLSVLLPEVSAMIGQDQPPEFHPEGDVFEHTVMMLNRMDTSDPALALSVLLHDVGKPPTAQDDNGRIRFNNHAQVGAVISGEILRRMRCPGQLVDAVAYMVGNHMRFMHVQEMREAKLRRLLGATTFSPELELHRLDCDASHGSQENYDFLREAMDRFDNEPALPAPWISGRDIMALGIAEGPDIGKWLDQAYTLQLECAESDRESLLQRIAADITSGL